MKLIHPYWWLCIFVFITHQIFQKGFGLSFYWIDSYLDNLLCMPIFLGIILWERRFVFRKNKMYRFTLFEIIIITILLSVLFEEGFPRWSSSFTRDLIDYLYYFVGALLFYFFHSDKSNQYLLQSK